MYPPNGLCWPFLKRLIIHKSEIQSLKRSKLHLCKNVEVLNFNYCKDLQEFDVTKMDNLRCIVVTGYGKLCHWIGLENLSNPVILRFFGNWKFMIMPKFLHGMTLLKAVQVLELEDFSWPRVDTFPPNLNGCTNL